MKTSSSHFPFLFIASTLAMLAGCAPLSPNLDSNFGASLNALKAYQIINPSAANNADNPTIDGASARESIDRYYKSYRAPTPHPNVFTIGVGSAAQ